MTVPVRCFCGCGAAPAGKKARFMPGHDSRLKKSLNAAYRTKTKVPNPFDPDLSPIDPYKLAKLLDGDTGVSYWQSAVVKAVGRRDRKAQADQKVDDLMAKLTASGKSLSQMRDHGTT